MRRKTWEIKELNHRALEFSTACGISIPFAQVLINRNIGAEDISSFLNPSLDYLHSWKLLPDIDKAVTRIKKSLKDKEKIFIVSDYDVDGITSAAIFHDFIKKYPGLYSFYIPHRINEGYGLSKEALAAAKAFGSRLIVAFDCGTNSFEAVEAARSEGMDVIVVDHHHPREDFNTPFAFVNPKRKGCGYPFADLSTGALSFKLLQALEEKPCLEALDLAALSIICDVVPLKGENRILLSEGLKRLRISRRPAIKSLCAAGGVKQANIDIFHIGFILGPRINASGRVAAGRESLEMFISEDASVVDSIAGKLGEYNKLRREIEIGILQEAEAIIEKNSRNDYAIVVAGRDWHPGVLGIVASRLAEKYYRPSFVFSLGKDYARGSARSIHSVHLMDVLAECAGSYEYGGHKKAAGMVIPADKIGNFNDKINTYLRANLPSQGLLPVCVIDLNLKFGDITLNLAEELEGLKPYGEENRQPLFAASCVSKKSSPVKIGSGYSLWLESGGTTLEAFIYDKDILEVVNFASTFDIVYALEKNSYHNCPRLVLKDIHLSEISNN